MTHQIVSHEEWLKARKAFLEKEKAFTKAREDLARERRELRELLPRQLHAQRLCASARHG